MTAPRHVQNPAGSALAAMVVWLTPLLLIAATAYLVSQALTVDPLGCTDPGQRYLPDVGLVLWAIGAVAVGRFVGYLRYRSTWTAAFQQQPLTRFAGTLGLCVFFLGAIIALVYEAAGIDSATVYGVASAEPITYYIRCAIYNDKTAHGGYAIFTLLILALIGAVVGHWLWAWHPPEQFD